MWGRCRLPLHSEDPKTLPFRWLFLGGGLSHRAQASSAWLQEGHIWPEVETLRRFLIHDLTGQGPAFPR